MRKLFIGLTLILSGLLGVCQTVTYTGMGSVTCPAVPVATISPAITGLSFSQLSRGSGVACQSAATGINGSGFNVTLVNAITNSKWYTFNITSDASTSFQVTNISIVSQVSSATGSPSVSVQYSIGAGPLTVVGSFTPTTTSTTYSLPTSISVGVSQVLNIFVIPNGLTAAGTTCRVNNNTSVTIGSVPTGGCGAHMTGALINSCNGTCQEGQNEILFFNSGPTFIAVNSINIKVYYESVNPPTVNYTESFISNAAYVASLNTLAGCGTIFYDGLSVGTIPANSIFMIMRQDPCYPYNLSAFCGVGNIYVLFTSDASWIVGGNFSNGGTAAGVLRYFRTTLNGCTIDYNYEPFLLTLGGDGDAISFPITGGAANAYFNNGCVPPPFILPIELVNFTTKCNTNSVELKWQTASEHNNDYFTIEKSKDGINFNILTQIKGSGTSNSPKSYEYIDKETTNGIIYYRLKQTDYDDSSKYFPIKSVNCENKTINLTCYPNPFEDYMTIEVTNFDSKAVVEIFDILGNKVETYNYTENLKINTSNLSQGTYFISFKSNEFNKITKIIK